MLILFVLLAVGAGSAGVCAGRGNWRGVGLALIGFGLCLRVHAGVSIAAISANGGLVPGWVDYYHLFATIPAGAGLLLAGLLVLCVRACTAWRSKRSR